MRSRCWTRTAGWRSQPYVVRLVADARRETPEASLGELAERLEIHRSAVQRALERLERLADARTGGRDVGSLRSGMIHGMRDVIVAANWKMHTTPADAGELARTIAARTRVPGVTRVICPPFVSLGGRRAMRWPTTTRTIAVGAQNVHHELPGAYTGEIVGADARRSRDVGDRRPLGAPSRRRRDRCPDRPEARPRAGCRAAPDPVRRRAARRARGRRAGSPSSAASSRVPWTATMRRRSARPAWSSPTSRSGRSAPAGTRAGADAAAMADAIRSALAGLGWRPRSAMPSRSCTAAA